MAILPPSLPGRIPTMPAPASIRPPLPVVPVTPVAERKVGDPPSPRPPRPGSFVDTWASPTAASGAGSPAASALAATVPAALLLSTPNLAHSSPKAEAARGRAARPAGTPIPEPLDFLRPLGGPEGPVDPESLARELRAGIESSGLFYESHLAEWVEGRRTLADVLAEARQVASAKVALAAAGEPDPVRDQQVDFLRQGEAAWRLPDTWGDSRLSIGEDAPEAWYAGVETAHIRLDLDLAGRGRVEVTLRIQGEELVANVTPAEGLRLEARDLAALSHRLGSLSGLRLAGLTVGPPVAAAASHPDPWRQAPAIDEPHAPPS